MSLGEPRGCWECNGWRKRVECQLQRPGQRGGCARGTRIEQVGERRVGPALDRSSRGPPRPSATHAASRGAPGGLRGAHWLPGARRGRRARGSRPRPCARNGDAANRRNPLSPPDAHLAAMEPAPDDWIVPVRPSRALIDRIVGRWSEWSVRSEVGDWVTDHDADESVAAFLLRLPRALVPTGVCAFCDTLPRRQTSSPVFVRARGRRGARRSRP